MPLSKAIIDAAHARNLKVAAHVFYLNDAKQLVEAGLDALVHSVRDAPVDDALIAAMKQRGAWMGAATLSRELSVFAYAGAPAWLDEPFLRRSVAADVVNTMKTPAYQKNVASDPHFGELPGFLETAKKNLKRLVDGGVKFGFGTDSGPPARFPGYFEHMEMELMVQAGLTPSQVIQAATRNAAEFLGESGNLGTLEVGRWADLIVMGRNPLADIRNTRSIEQVYIGGNRI
jgi:imidazolonepropionase-like amidohydrolase